MDVVLERRLRPVYDMIELKNFKGALKQANTLLQKHPGSLHLKLLKALVLERQGKDEEALSLCRQVKDAKPTDERVLNDLYQIFYRLGHLGESTQSYENACACNPGNVELDIALFVAYVREDNYVKQQQVASRLYKKVGEEKYLMWAICSLELQVKCNAEQGNKLLQLAEAMLKKRVTIQGLKEHESLLVYLNILQRQGKYDAALEVLLGSLGQLFTITADRLRLQADLYMRLGHFKEAKSVYEEVLRLSSDDWALLLAYLDAVLECAPVSTDSRCEARKLQVQGIGTASSSPLAYDEMEKRLAMATETLQELQARPAGGLNRGPFLAQLEIARRKTQHKDAAGTEAKSTQQLAEVIAAYFQRFGSMVSFASDVEQYTQLVEGESRLWLSVSLQTTFSEVSDEPEQQLRRQISALQVDEHLQILSSITSADLVNRAKKMLSLYEKSIPLSSVLEVKEKGHGAELLNLASNCLVELFSRSGVEAYLVEAVLILELALKQRPFNPQQKLLVISLYSMMGAPNLAWKIFQTLDVKHILLETLSHHVIRPLLQCGCWQEARSLFALMTTFHEDHRRDSPDLTSVAFRHGTYSKILEFIEFRDTLQRSHSRLLMRIEGQIASLCVAADNREEVERLLFQLEFGKPSLEWVLDSEIENLAFTEDFSTRPWWWPAPNELHLQTGIPWESSGRLEHWSKATDEKSRREDLCKFAKRRCFLPRLLSLALEVEGNSNPGNVEELQNLANSLSWLSGFDPNALPSKSSNLESLIAMSEQGLSLADLLEVSLFMASSTFLKASVGAVKMPEDGLSLGQSFASEVKFIENIFKKVVEVILRAAVVPIERSYSANGSQETTVLPGKDCVLKTEEVHTDGKNLRLGLGTRGLSELVANHTAWLVLILQHWRTRLNTALGQKKKKKSGEKLGEGTAAGIIGSFTAVAQGAVKDLLTNVIASLESICNLLESYLGQPVGLETASWLSSMGFESNGVDDDTGGGFKIPLDISPGSVLREFDLGSVGDQEDVVTGMVHSQRDIVKQVYDLAVRKAVALKSITR